MKAKNVIAIATGLTTFIPILSCDGMNLDECKRCISSLKKTSPANMYTVIGGGNYEVSAHAKEYKW